MRRIVLPGTELETSRLGYGTGELHLVRRRRDREALLRTALESGFTHIDTARVYGEGSAERDLGRYLGSARREVSLATKFGIPVDPLLEHAPWLIHPRRALGKLVRRVKPGLHRERPRCVSRDCIEDDLKRSFEALRTDWLDLFFLHNPRAGEVSALLAVAGYLERLREEGIVRYLGLSGLAADCVAVLQQTGSLFDVLQVEDSIQGREADVVIAARRPLQISFGYVHRAAETTVRPDAPSLIAEGLRRNSQGMVLVSSRRPERIRELARLGA